MRYLTYIFIFAFIISGCSSKQYFEPKHTDGNYTAPIEDIDAIIIDHNSDGATLENKQFISKDGLENIVLRDGYRFINKVNGTIIAADHNMTLQTISDLNHTQEVKFDQDVASASIKDNLLAVGFIDNSIMLYDIDKKEVLFKEYLKHSFVNDTKIANPVFLNSVVLYPTLDGKIVIVDINRKKVIKNINIDPDSDVNNIIFLDNVDESLIAASTYKLFSFIDGRINMKNFNIKQILVKDNYIYIATLEGEIIKLDLKLNVISKQKFKFANFHSLGVNNNNIYALESQSFMIKIDNDFKDTKIYNFDFDEEEKSVIIKDKLYFEDSAILLK